MLQFNDAAFHLHDMKVKTIKSTITSTHPIISRYLQQVVSLFHE